MSDRATTKVPTIQARLQTVIKASRHREVVTGSGAEIEGSQPG